MALSSKLASKAMGAMERTKKFLGLPGYDEATAAAQKEVDDEIARLKKLDKSKELTASEERKLDRLMNRKIREESAERESGMASERKGKGLSEKEKKEMQESLEFKKGGMAKKPAKKMAMGGMVNPMGGQAAQKAASTQSPRGRLFGGRLSQQSAQMQAMGQEANAVRNVAQQQANAEMKINNQRAKASNKSPSQTGFNKGGMSTGYNKGGMANCGASMKPNGPKKGK